DKGVIELRCQANDEPLPPGQAGGLAMARVDAADAAEPGRRRAVDVGALVVGVDDVGLQLPEEAGQLKHQLRAQALGDIEGGDGPAGGLDLIGDGSAALQGDEVEGEALAAGVAGQLDEELLLPADLQAEGDVDDAAEALARHAIPGAGS